MNAAAAPEATRKMLTTLWDKNLPVVKERVEELRQAAEFAAFNKLSSDARISAEGTAHKLAGSLGMFGYQHGTEIARELEQMLEGSDSLDVSRLNELARELQTELSL